MANILIIDDDESVRMLLTHQLQKLGHSVIAAEDGFQAFNCLSTASVNLIITDIFMPEKDGIEFLTEFTRKPPSGVNPKSIGIIAMTGDHHILDIPHVFRMARCLGAVETMRKPFTLEELKKKIDLLLALGQPSWGNSWGTTMG
ncbi:MAG: response regulator [Magnetococcales bacterium]|nr:response regulator [Magnetococcales bacterium]NGZ26032.1 response regulator [Magnetococcales bacterium]